MSIRRSMTKVETGRVKRQFCFDDLIEAVTCRHQVL